MLDGSNKSIIDDIIDAFVCDIISLTILQPVEKGVNYFELTFTNRNSNSIYITKYKNTATNKEFLLQVLHPMFSDL